MAIIIKNQFFFSEVGKRDNNEDNGGWNEGLTYIVCDGVGGNEKGEIASSIITNTFLQIYKENPLSLVNTTLQITESKLTDFIAKNPESFGMASTLVLTNIQPNGILVAWVGDSRVYQFRKSEIVFKTTDHSWVNEAIAAGILTPDEALNHPKSNIITRAVQGNHKPVQAEEVLLCDIKKDDLFLLCSDGVIETWSDDDLIALFNSNDDIESIAKKIKEECLINSKDNNTAIIFKIEDVSGIEILKNKRDLESINDIQNDSKIQNEQKQKYLKLIIIFILFFSALILSILYFKDIKNIMEPLLENKIK
jgi:serine/threonine protein phosphatase PrpC